MNRPHACSAGFRLHTALDRLDTRIYTTARFGQAIYVSLPVGQKGNGVSGSVQGALCTERVNNEPRGPNLQMMKTQRLSFL